MLNLIVAGAGEGTYKKLWDSVQNKNPDLQMRLAIVIDVKPREELDPRMQDVLEKSEARYLQVASSAEILNLGTNNLTGAVGIVMTPNDSHYDYARHFVKLGVPAFVEKPIATVLAEAEALRETDLTTRYLLYGAEFCTDGKGIGLLLASGAMRPNDPRLPFIKMPSGMEIEEVQRRFATLGQLTKVEGTLLEGSGTAATADHRPWLLEGNHGGMIRDLAAHLVGPLIESGLVKGPAFPNPHVTLGRHLKGDAPGTYHPLTARDQGETYAKMHGQFHTGNGRTAPFAFQVGKYWPAHNRSLTMDFEHEGWARLSYEPPFDFTFGARGNVINLQVTGDPYTLALLDFREFVMGRQDGHMERAVEIVRFNEHMRAIGIRKLSE